MVSLSHPPSHLRVHLRPLITLQEVKILSVCQAPWSLADYLASLILDHCLSSIETLLDASILTSIHAKLVFPQC